MRSLREEIIIKLEVGQQWVSETHPYEDFEIYDGIGDTINLEKYYDENDFENLPETAKVFFWKRINVDAFYQLIESKKGKDYQNTFPYVWYGESKKSSIVRKIKKYNMILKK